MRSFNWTRPNEQPVRNEFVIPHSILVFTVVPDEFSHCLEWLAVGGQLNEFLQLSKTLFELPYFQQLLDSVDEERNTWVLFAEQKFRAITGMFHRMKPIQNLGRQGT